MRKFKILIFPLCLVFLCACSKPKVTPVTDGISFAAHIFYYNKEYSCVVVAEKGGDTVLTVTEPELLSGAKVVISEKDAYAEFKDIKYPVDLSRAAGAPYFLLGCLKEAKNKEAEKGSEQYVIKGTHADIEYEMVFAESGIPLKITGENIEIEIFDAKIKTAG